MLPILVIFIVASSCILWQYLLHGHIMQLGIFFNLLAMAYMVFGLAISWNQVSEYTFMLEQIGWMSVIAVIGFNISYIVFRSYPSRVAWRSPDYLPSHTALLFFTGIGLSFQLAAILLTGPLDFFLSDRVDRFAFFHYRKAMFYLGNLTNVCLPIILLRYLTFGQQNDRKLFYFLLCYSLLYGIVTISRFDLSITLIVILYFWERSGTLRPYVIIGILLIAFVISIFFKPAFYEVILDKPYQRLFDYNEYTNWIRHTVLLMSRPEVELPHNGYLLTLKSLFVLSPEQESLSEWFFREFYLDKKVLFPGLGYGFSGLWEGYVANGLTGIALHFAFFGALFGLIERSPTAMRHVFIVFAMILAYRLFRSEVYNFTKTYAWYFAYPTFAIVVADKFMSWASNHRAVKTPYLYGTTSHLHHNSDRLTKS